MNYDSSKNYAVSIEKLGLDTNGNRVKKLTFFKRVDGLMQKYKVCKTNESLDTLTVDRVVKVWGEIKTKKESK